MTAVQSILHLSTYDIVGGASRAAYRLHTGLRQQGIASRMLVREKASDDPDVLVATEHPEPILHRAWRKIAPYLDEVPRPLVRTNNITPISPAWLPGPTARDVRRAAPSLVNLHWVCGGFLTPESLVRLGTPLVWTLHDQWAFCGGEHYTEEDRRFAEGYRSDNRAVGEGGLDVNRWIWARKRRAYRRVERLAAVAPSRWIADLARKSILLADRRVEHIPYGIDSSRFHPIDRDIARDILGLPRERRFVLFGAFGGINNPRKGFSLLASALRHLASDGRGGDLELIIFGSGADDVPINVGIPARSMGVLHDDISLALIYAAADVYVATSSADNLPLTVMEAMACGIPVIGVAVGGMADIVKDGETGRLITSRDPATLAQALEWVLADESRRRRLGVAARALIEREYTLARQATRYAALYQQLTAVRY
jgi:glycosyltransferase involved in cell wall biosynthesis